MAASADFIPKNESPTLCNSPTTNVATYAGMGRSWRKRLCFCCS